MTGMIDPSAEHLSKHDPQGLLQLVVNHSIVSAPRVASDAEFFEFIDRSMAREETERQRIADDIERLQTAAAVEEVLLDRHLAADLDTELRMRPLSRASTQKRYDACFRRFKEYVAPLGFDTLPFPPAIVAAFLTQQCVDGVLLSSIRQSAAAIAAKHHEAGFISPMNQEITRAAMRFVAREAARKPKAEKEH